MSTAVKRERSDEVHQPMKRQQTIVGEHSSIPVATLLNLIPGKEQTISIDNKTVTTVGRSRSCDIILTETDISTVHCELYLIKMNIDNIERSLINIIDKSRNGTFINGNRLVKKDCILKNGDRVVFGKGCSFLFKYTASSNLQEIEDSTATSQSEHNEEFTGESVVATKSASEVVFKKPQLGFTSSQNATKKIVRTKQLSFFDKYVLGKDLGSGHYATVKEGINKVTGQTVAVKIFHPQQNDDEKKSKQFREETNILMRIHHPNIVNLLDFFIEPVSKSQIQKYLVLDLSLIHI